MKRQKPPPLFATEAELCASFIAHADGKGWQAYAETAGWDILLVRRSDGVQVGVQAKLRLNLEVIQQSLPRYFLEDGNGPDFRAVLVPNGCGGFEQLLAHLGLVFFMPRAEESFEAYREALRRGDKERERTPEWRAKWIDNLVPEGGVGCWNNPWQDWNPAQRCVLPAYIPDVAAGASGPVQLTPWKVGALRVLARLELRGAVTRTDFKRAGIDYRLWVQRAWLQPGALRGSYTAGPVCSGIRAQHPRVYAEIIAEERVSLSELPNADAPHP